MNEEVKRQTLVFPMEGSGLDQRVFLGKKKAIDKLGFGKIHGFGGNLQGGEGYLEAAARELEEESGLRGLTEDLIYRAKLTIYEEGNLVRIVRSYCLYKWEGTPEITEEMDPISVLVNDLPLDQMFEDTSLWLPNILGGEEISLRLWYSKNFGKLQSSSILPFKHHEPD